ncbi:MAG: DUF4230 domain-containing protein [Kiritimatiellae bacterium]|nr:DUF4230 domain-containing protein [Kiritimatiellia bacterium]
MDLWIVIVMTALATVALAGWIASARKRRGTSMEVTLQSSLEHLRAVGQLSVFKAWTRDIVTATDHTWGDFGRKYLSWILSEKKMALIFEFEIDFRYDLRTPEFQISAAPGGGALVRLPPCLQEARIRDIRFYDEQNSRLIPWLLPDLLNGFLTKSFTEEDKNRLIASAKKHAEAQARSLIENVQPEVQASARATLESLARAFGVREVQFEFAPQVKTNIPIVVSGSAAA